LASQTCFVIANTLMAHYARWIDHLGGSVRQVGWIMGAGAVLGVIVRPWMGQWINRLGSRTMWLIGFGIFSIGSFCNLLLADLNPTIYVLRSCLVLGAAIVFASSLTYITQTTPPHRHTEAIGILGVGGFLGMLLGPVLGDLFLSAERTRGNFAMLFIAAGLGCIVPAFLVCFLRAPPGQSPKSAVRLMDFIRTTRRNWPGTILMVDLAFGVCMTVPFVFLASYIDQASLKISGISLIGLFFWCYAGWGLTVRVLLRRMPERIGRRKVLLAGMVFMSIGMFCFVLVDNSSSFGDRNRSRPDVSHDDCTHDRIVSDECAGNGCGTGTDDAGCGDDCRRPCFGPDRGCVGI
jgi:MFS family permease